MGFERAGGSCLYLIQMANASCRLPRDLILASQSLSYISLRHQYQGILLGSTSLTLVTLTLLHQRSLNIATMANKNRKKVNAYNPVEIERYDTVNVWYT